MKVYVISTTQDEADREIEIKTIYDRFNKLLGVNTDVSKSAFTRGREVIKEFKRDNVTARGVELNFSNDIFEMQAFSASIPMIADKGKPTAHFIKSPSAFKLVKDFILSDKDIYIVSDVNNDLTISSDPAKDVEEKRNLNRGNAKYIPSTDQNVGFVFINTYALDEDAFTYDSSVANRIYIPQWIALGHELVHAHRDKLGGGMLRNLDREEIQTIGVLFHFYPFDENRLREEHGLPLRGTHEGGFTSDLTETEKANIRMK